MPFKERERERAMRGVKSLYLSLSSHEELESGETTSWQAFLHVLLKSYLLPLTAAMLYAICLLVYVVSRSLSPSFSVKLPFAFTLRKCFEQLSRWQRSGSRKEKKKKRGG